MFKTFFFEKQYVENHGFCFDPSQFAHYISVSFHLILLIQSQRLSTSNQCTAASVAEGWTTWWVYRNGMHLLSECLYNSHFTYNPGEIGSHPHQCFYHVCCRVLKMKKSCAAAAKKRFKQRKADHKDKNNNSGNGISKALEPRQAKGSFNKRSHNSKPYQENHASFCGYQPEMTQNRDIGQVVHRVPCFPAIQISPKIGCPKLWYQQGIIVFPHIFMVNPQFSNKPA